MGMSADRAHTTTSAAALGAVALDVAVVLRGEVLLGLAMAPLLVLCVVAPLVASLRTLRAGHAARAEARRDALTGLPNLEQLRDDIAALAADPGAAPQTLEIFDLVGFKKYNDAYGFACGDTLLSRLARRFADMVGEDGVPYRLRGAQFAVLSTAGPVELSRQRERCADALFEIGEGFMIRCAHGTVSVPDRAHDASEALKLADQEVQAERTRLSRQGLDERALSPLGDRAARLARSPYEVDELAGSVGAALGLVPAEIETLETAATLRDVGMMSIPDAIVHAPTGLTDEDWRFVRLHTLVGERLLRSNFGMDEVAGIVRSSHERWDGRGYPDGLAGEDIPLASRVVFVCSAFQDMTSPRAHRAALSADEALAELVGGAGTQFDPGVVGAFATAFGRTFRGTSGVHAAR